MQMQPETQYITSGTERAPREALYFRYEDWENGPLCVKESEEDFMFIYFCAYLFLFSPVLAKRLPPRNPTGAVVETMMAAGQIPKTSRERKYF